MGSRSVGLKQLTHNIDRESFAVPKYAGIVPIEVNLRYVFGVAKPCVYEGRVFRDSYVETKIVNTSVVICDDEPTVQGG